MPGIVTGMNTRYEELIARIAERFGATLLRVPSSCGELTYEVDRTGLVAAARTLRDDPAFRFEMLVDLTGMDYLSFGQDEWQTDEATSTGFSRAATRETIVTPPDAVFDARRFAAVYHLLSVSGNYRLRLRAFSGPDNPPVLPSVTDIWASANWYEREAFDLYGILFEGHPDLRRLLTDYGFIGNPFRKDFPLSGNVEVRYDADKGRVIYQPVSIEPRVLVPRIIRDDNRYQNELKDRPARG
jgi:NADH-quinone oxidoreductase subunit C